MLTILLCGYVVAAPAQKIPELPHKVSAAAKGSDFTVARSVTVTTANRDDRAPEPVEKRANFRKSAERALQGTVLTVVPTSTPAQLSLQLLMAPSVRYGQYHYQTAPYDYLLLRDNTTGETIYCAYERLMVFRSASSELLSDLRKMVKGESIAPGPRDMRECLEQAHAPLVVIVR